MAIPLHLKQVVSTEKLLMSQGDQREALTRLVVEKWTFTHKEDER